jgi:hypothetical protein
LRTPHNINCSRIFSEDRETQKEAMGVSFLSTFTPLLSLVPVPSHRTATIAAATRYPSHAVSLPYLSESACLKQYKYKKKKFSTFSLTVLKVSFPFL